MRDLTLTVANSANTVYAASDTSSSASAPLRASVVVICRPACSAVTVVPKSDRLKHRGALRRRMMTRPALCYPNLSHNDGAASKEVACPASRERPQSRAALARLQCKRACGSDVRSARSCPRPRPRQRSSSADSCHQHSAARRAGFETTRLASRRTRSERARAKEMRHREPSDVAPRRV